MKKLKYLLFIFVLFLTPSVFAKDITNYIQYDLDNPTGTYKGDEIYNGGYNGKFNVKTRYNGKLSMLEFVLSSNYFDFNVNTVYTITLNMATNDWRNNFMGPQVIKLNSNGSQQTTNASLSVSNFQFVSRKSIKFNFKTNSSISPYLLFRLYSTDYATTDNIAITGDTNWNLSSIVITPATSSSGSGSGSGSSSSSSSTTCNNGLVISSSTYNYSDVDISSKYLGSSGEQVNYSNFGIISYIPVSSNSTYYLSRNLSASSVANYCLYNSSKTLISCSQYGTSTSFTINTGNASYISLSLRNDYIFTLATCKSPLDNQNDNTQNIIDNQNQNTTNIIENNNDNTQQIIENTNDSIDALSDALSGAVSGASNGIINNNNQNTDKTIDSQKVCKELDNSSTSITGYYLNVSGSPASNDLYSISSFYSLNKDSKLTLITPNNQATYNCFYTSNKTLISCFKNSTTPAGPIEIPENASYFRYSIRLSSMQPVFSLCVNGNQALNDSINDTNNYLKDDSDPTIDDSALSEVFGKVHFTDPLSYLLTLPTQLINKIVSMSDTCSPIDLGTLYGVHLTLPCINLENYLGSDLWNILDVILSVGLLSVILKNFYDTISNLLTLGGEKEAKEKFSMPTPMDFLAMILGGDNR